MATLTIQHTSGAAGLAVTWSFAAAAGDVYASANLQTLQVQNLSSAAATVTITAQHTCNQGTLHTLTFSIAAGATRLLGPFASQFYNDAGGNVDVTYSAVALPAPASPTVSNSASGGTVAAGTYQVEITYVNAQGETVASASASTITTGATSTITVNSPAAAGSGAGAATAWYAYVTQAGGSTYTRQQAAGSPTAIGTNLTISAPPTNTGLNPPAANTAGALQVAVTAP